MPPLRTAIAVLIVCCSWAVAVAQPASPPPLDTFLKQRVVEELATEGTLLSRLGVGLEIEVAGDRLIVSLVDPATHRAVASTKIDNVPVDREAAVASVTHVVAGLVGQLNTSASTANAVQSALSEDRKVRRAQEESEAAYKAEAITFGDMYAVTTTNNSTTVAAFSVPYRGNRRLTLDEFFTAVDRPDLVEERHHRLHVGWGASITGIALLGVSAYLMFGPGRSNIDKCPIGSSLSDFDTCVAAEDARAHKYEYAGLGFGGAALVAATIGYFYFARSSPINDIEGQDLANAYNAKVRRKYGLPGASLAPRHVRDVLVAPYASADGGGVAVMGRF